MKNIEQTGNFRSGEMFAGFTNSNGFDRRLFDADARVNMAYCDALFGAGILTRTEAERIKNGLQAILKRAGYDANYFSEMPAADIHSFAETRLVQLVGETARLLNVGRSRADHAATVFRLWLREETEKITRLTRAVQMVLIEAAEKQRAAILPGYAPLRQKQPILWAHWCLAFFERFARDRERLDEVWRRVNILPLASGFSAGTNFEIDREELAKSLGFEGVTLNSIDAVTDGDFAIEFVGACAILMTHLARLAEDLTLFSSDEFRFIQFSIEKVSNFPSKKSGALDFIRGKTGRVFGHQTALAARLTTTPKAHGADLRETEEAVFDTVDTVKICLETAAAVFKNLRVRENATKDAASKNCANISELKDYLLHKNVPYQTACEAAEKISDFAETSGKRLNETSLAEMQKFSASIERDVFDALDLEQTLAQKSQIGGTAPERVFDALETARNSLEMEE